MRARWEEVQGRVAGAAKGAGRHVEEILILPASKTQPAETLRILWELGVRRFGENRVQEAKAKVETLPGGTVWDFIGSLQTNKARDAVRLFEWIHSVDRAELVDELQRRAGQFGKIQKVLVEVNVGGEATKHGCAPGGLMALLEHANAQPNLEVHGLMTVAPFTEDPEGARPYFAQLRELRDVAECKLELRLPELSMGMTHDYQQAIAEGATIVRIGTALFGERQR
ncbi:MAG: YggS family pyridoxal phosphate-dependent enzyme [Bdellovibrionaceae bacterium]|nr:YggS family pyridoxal phosphate-dependent enzyme [Pseudobdellovibrionaceae bacterium]